VRLLALDPGESFGWALSNSAEINVNDYGTAKYYIPNYRARIGNLNCLCGAWDFSEIKDSGQRFNLVSELVEVRKDLAGIVYEVAPGLRGHASIWHLGYLATVAASAHRLDVPFYKVNASTWKKYALRSPRASKEESQDEALVQYGLDPQAVHDASDALHILAWGLQS
jgi:hypothetical protein